MLHFVGASPSSTSHIQTMRRIGEELKRRSASSASCRTSQRGWRRPSANLLIEAGSKAQRAVALVLDGLNQLEASGGALGLAWLPEFLPDGHPDHRLDAGRASRWRHCAGIRLRSFCSPR